MAFGNMKVLLKTHVITDVPAGILAFIFYELEKPFFGFKNNKLLQVLFLKPKTVIEVLGQTGF